MAAIVYIFPSFQNCERCEKKLKDNNYDILHLGRNYAQILVLGHYLFLEAHSFPRAVSYEEQIMSADKYPSIFSRQMVTFVYIFSPQMATIVFIILQIFL